MFAYIVYVLVYICARIYNTRSLTSYCVTSERIFFTDLNTFSINSICEANTEVLIGNTYAQYHSERVLKSYPRVL